MELQQYDGFWKGRPVKYSVILVEITNRLGGIRHWAAAFIGEKRQAVRVDMANTRPFYLDNEDGTGLATIKKQEVKKAIHRNLGEPKELEEIPKSNWITKVDKSITKSILAASDAYWNRPRTGSRGHGSGQHGSSRE